MDELPLSTNRLTPTRDFRGLTPPPILSLYVLVGLALLGGAMYFYLAERGLINLLIDERAHLCIARRLWDSKTPGYEQLGTVWLPLPHVLAAPLTLSDRLWRSGAAGSIVSLLAGAGAGFYFFRLLWLASGSSALALAGTALFALNPNWLYIQATPMTEPLLTFAMVAAVFYVARFAERQKWRDLIAAALLTALAALTRYEGWFLIPLATLAVGMTTRGGRPEKLGRALSFAAMASLAPIYWLSHNRVLFSDPLEFERGPYSALAIYARQIAETGFRYPTDHRLVRSLGYYLESARLNCGTALLLLATIGLALLIWRRPRPAALTALLMLTPLLAYTASLYGGHVSIYMPHLFPFTHYNIRYGLAMLPALVFLAVWAIRAVPSQAARGLLIAVLLVQNGWLARRGLDQTILLEEARINAAKELRLADFAAGYLRRSYDFGNVLVFAGGNASVIQRSQLSFRQTIYEGNTWLWEAARRFPLGAARWVVTRRGDPLWDWVRTGAAAACFERVAELPGEVEVYRQRGDGPARRAGRDAFIIAGRVR